MSSPRYYSSIIAYYYSSISHHFHGCTALLALRFVVVKWRYIKYLALPFLRTTWNSFTGSWRDPSSSLAVSITPFKTFLCFRIQRITDYFLMRYRKRVSDPSRSRCKVVRVTLCNLDTLSILGCLWKFSSIYHVLKPLNYWCCSRYMSQNTIIIQNKFSRRNF